jgi:hypothetical protein
MEETKLIQSSSENQQSNPINRKLNKILESRIENDKVIKNCFCF